MRGGILAKKKGGRFKQPPLTGLDVRRYFFLMTIVPRLPHRRGAAPFTPLHGPARRDQINCKFILQGTRPLS